MNDPETDPKNKISESRLSDRILFALELALDQDDYATAETLRMALEKSMTRNTGGGMFIERREYPERVQRALNRLNELKKTSGN